MVNLKRYANYQAKGLLPDISHIQYAHYERRDEINVTKLLEKHKSEEQKIRLWKRMKANRPDICAILKDKNVRAIVKHFDAIILMDRKYEN